MNMDTRAGSAGIGALFLLFTMGCVLEAQTAEATFERTLVVDGDVDLDVRTGSGSVQFRSGPGGTVQITGRIRGRQTIRGEDVFARVKEIADRPPVQQQGNAVRLGLNPEDERFENISISYEIVAPFETRLRTRTGSGSQTIGSVRGPVNVSTGSGDIHIGHVGGDVEAATGSGTVQLQRADGVFNARSGSGTIQATAVAGSVRAHTGSGRIEVAQVAGGSVDVEAGSGPIRVTGAREGLRARSGSGSINIEGAPRQPWSVRTGSGEINLRLEPQSSFTLNASTGSGSVDTTHPVTMAGRSSSRRLEGTVRGGGAAVNLSAGSGSISVR